jgi:hypothetical protein
MIWSNNSPCQASGGREKLADEQRRVEEVGLELKKNPPEGGGFFYYLLININRKVLFPPTNHTV